jgi:hypothetical protein
MGLFWGLCAWAGLPYFGLEASRAAFFTLAILGAALGAWLYGSRSVLSLWCGGMAALLGIVGFFGGYIGSVGYYGRSPQVALFALFVSGPYGTLIGAIFGLIIWASRKARGKPFARWSPGPPSPPTVWDRELDGPPLG